ncbi:MAG TPA: pyridine nucleotide transhydrogenase [Porphyromonadaceae bacterium]|mgnify:FL=1|jgi:NAD(P) transhydrogenase subunit alpha|uniref:NAD(P) transhydrogenase subunit alpha n=1 Tax=Petrimonas sp. TaxID=2023866 RepID=UPI000E7E688B|nr:NAD(P) transhydrogenase subunit alpha [Petrimonas sp.]HBC38687.1 pyridine nucleotide transhydrogenase [Porphyromonadaceae bacterium]MDD4015498.1 NAD(P) transhydrogenase subunit alpha [Petrimonas sp.]MDX9775176.1 NAD(P) transhydrogenase subunit alpha [Petrimonas sp.]MEA4996211.1 NAD(P) transhydrogenase subunit alpha [Petrimonas sp.]
MNPVFLIVIFALATGVGYVIIKNVPSLLHTPLMSGMNALSGITILGAVAAVGLSVAAVRQQDVITGQILGGLAVVAATVNVVGGFGVTHRMLKMFDKKKKEERPS